MMDAYKDDEKLIESPQTERISSRKKTLLSSHSLRSMMANQKPKNQESDLDSETSARIENEALEAYNKIKGNAANKTKSLFTDAFKRKEQIKERKDQRDKQLKEQSESVEQKYSESNQVFMCIRITRELKQIYEKEIKIELNMKIGFTIFVKILTIMGYLSSNKVRFNTKDFMAPTMSSKEEMLVQLAWNTVKSKGDKDTSVYGIEDYIEHQQKQR